MYISIVQIEYCTALPKKETEKAKGSKRATELQNRRVGKERDAPPPPPPFPFAPSRRGIPKERQKRDCSSVGQRWTICKSAALGGHDVATSLMRGRFASCIVRGVRVYSLCSSLLCDTCIEDEGDVYKLA